MNRRDAIESLAEEMVFGNPPIVTLDTLIELGLALKEGMTMQDLVEAGQNLGPGDCDQMVAQVERNLNNLFT